MDFNHRLAFIQITRSEAVSRGAAGAGLAQLRYGAVSVAG
jgi:hypothetical protein